MATRRSRRDDLGAVFVVVAGAMTVLILMAGLAVDLGQQRFARRDAQANADVIALDMARVANGRPMTEISAIPGIESGPDQLEQSLTRNGIGFDTIKKGVNNGALVVDNADGRRLEVQWGWLSEQQMLPSDPSATCSVGEQVQIRPDGPWWMDCRQGNSIPNAAKVTVYDHVDFLFLPAGGGADGAGVARTAYARFGGTPTAEFGLGSTLASVNLGQGKLLGGILGNIIPGADLLGYGGIANAQVTLGRLAVELGAATPQGLADVNVPFDDFMLATVRALEAEGDLVAAGVLGDLIALGVPETEVNVGDLVGIGNSGSNGLDGVVGIPHLLTVAGLAIANNTNAITIPAAGLGIPGLVDVTLNLSAIESAIRIGTLDEAEGSTEQIDIGVSLNLDLSADHQQRICQLPSGERTILGALLGGIFRLLNCLLAPLTSELLDVQLQGQIDLDISVARVWALQNLDCGTGTMTVDYDADPATVTPSIDLAATVKLGGNPLNLLGLNIDGTAVTATGSEGSVAFQVADDGPMHVDFVPPTARIGSPHLGLANLLQIGGLEVVVLNTNLPVIGGIAKGLVAPLLNTLLGAVDSILITELSKLLGLNLGGADITPHWMHCDNYGVALVG